MFYRLGAKVEPISSDEIDENQMIAGYLSAQELVEIGRKFGFSHTTIEACQVANQTFRSGVDVFDDYTFTELNIVDPQHVDDDNDCVALLIKKNMIIVVDVLDRDSSTKNKFIAAINKRHLKGVTIEKVVYAFLEYLIAGSAQYIEKTGNSITELEEDVIKGNTDDDFNLDLMTLKKELLTMHNYYEQLLDITEALEENENDLFVEEDLRYIANMNNKIQRLKEDIDSLSSLVVHLQDAYSASLDLSLNHTMKRFTVITSIFFPLTLIVGWYGMNFDSMAEFHWKYGYLFVILLSIAVVTVLAIIGKKKKWF
ncbi:MAG: hypothetical protein IJI67_02985 [Clostridia bacterium]|nr:hypothetical protein [Clostridia bacterium]